MRTTSKRASSSLPLKLFAASGAVAFLAVLLPSPLRLNAYKTVETASPKLLYPADTPSMPRDALALIAEHPLFNADRQQDPAPQMLAQLPALDNYRLAGVVVTGETRIAIIEKKASKTTVTLKIGDLLDGRTIKEISAEGVSFSSLAGTEMLTIPNAMGASLVTKSSGLNNNASGAKALGNGGINK